MKLIAFCEAAADFRLVSGLVDRVLREHGPSWIRDSLDVPGAVRTWHADDAGREYIDLHRLNDHADALERQGIRVRRVRGHFNGRPGQPGGAMARRRF